MAYQKQNYENGQILKASHLNAMEDDISVVEESVTDVAETVDVLTPIINETDIMAGSAASSGCLHRVIE